jgi:hypothetical protein
MARKEIYVGCIDAEPGTYVCLSVRVYAGGELEDGKVRERSWLAKTYNRRKERTGSIGKFRRSRGLRSHDRGLTEQLRSCRRPLRGRGPDMNTLAVDLDGTLFTGEDRADYEDPASIRRHTTPHEAAVGLLRDVYHRVRVYIVTARTQDLEDVTRHQLARVFDAYHTTKYTFSPTPTSTSVTASTTSTPADQAGAHFINADTWRLLAGADVDPQALEGAPVHA